MDWDQNALPILCQSFIDSLSIDNVARLRGEKNLSILIKNRNYCLNVLRLVAEPSFAEQIRLRAAVNLNNHLNTRWIPSSTSDLRIPDDEKEQIKTSIVLPTISSTVKIQDELRKAIAIIGNYDFPKSWPNLLPDLKSRLETALNADDFALVNGILSTVHSLFKRFKSESSLYKRARFEFKNGPLWVDLKHCSEKFAAPLLSTVVSISNKINDVGRTAATLQQLLEARKLCCNIFNCLTYLHVDEEFEDKQDEWMNEFKNYLNTVQDGAVAECLSLVDEIQAAVCETVSQYMKNKDAKKHLHDFVEAVLSLLENTSASGRVHGSAYKFLGSIIDSASSKELRRDIIPHVMLRDEDVELFEKYYSVFIVRDMKENGLSTRRRITCELLKDIKNKEIIRGEIKQCLKVYDENPAAEWKQKECAICLIVSLATVAGASISTDLVDVESFFRSYILPELVLQQGQWGQEHMNALPMLKAAALKFFAVFCALIPKDLAMPLLRDLVRYVVSYVEVVKTYAAICIEKLLLLKDNNINGGVQQRYTSQDIYFFQEDLICNLGMSLNAGPFFEEKYFILRCMMRLIAIASDKSGYMLAACINELVSYLGDIYLEAKVYNFFLFETLAFVIKRTSGERDNTKFIYFQNEVIRAVGPFLDEGITVLFPYALQILTQIIELNGCNVEPRNLMTFFDCLFYGVEWWETAAPTHFPLLTRLMLSFIQQLPNDVNKKRRSVSDEVNKKTRLGEVVLFSITRLVSSPDKEEEGFRVLNTVIETYGYGTIAENMEAMVKVWDLLLARLQNQNSNSKTPRFVRCVIVFLSLYLVKHGVQTLVDLVGVKLFYDVILPEFWVPNLNTTITTTGYNNEVKLVAIASTKLLYESATLLNFASEDLWGSLLDAIVSLLSLPLPEEERETVEEDDDFDKDIDFGGFVPLRNASGLKQEDWDPVAEIEDPLQFLVTFPGKLFPQFNGMFPQNFMRHLSQHNQATLVDLCNSYRVVIAGNKIVNIHRPEDPPEEEEMDEG